jgi:hypothetical protein
MSMLNLKAKIHLLPFFLQALHMHDHEGHDLQFSLDANPPDNTPAEFFMQESRENSITGGYSHVFSGVGAGPVEDCPASRQSTCRC